MQPLRDNLSPHSEAVQANRNAYIQIVNDLHARLHRVYQGGHGRQHHEAQQKLFVRERIRLLCDSHSDFFELSPLAAEDVYDEPLPAAGIITGIGSIQGQDVMIMANDASTKAGCYYPLTIKKQLRAQEIALRHHLPCIYLLDSGGIYLPLQAESCAGKEHIGRLCFMQARMSALGIAQISVVMGSCTAASAYLATMADELIMVKNQGGIFLGGPYLVKAATGEEISAEDLGGTRLHTQISGVADHAAGSEVEALEMVRHAVASLNSTFGPKHPLQKVIPPLYPAEDLYALIPVSEKSSCDARAILARLLDGSLFQEFKANYGPQILCGFGLIHGYRLGIIANQGPIDSQAALKATHFIELASQRKLPLFFLQNTRGFMVGSREEALGISKHGAKLMHAVANTSVPKLSLIISSVYGAAYFAMAGMSFEPDFIWAWPQIKMAATGFEQAKIVLSSIKKNQQIPASDIEIQNMLEQYQAQSSAYYFASQVHNDGVIDPINTRDILGRALEIVLRKPIQTSHFGVFRM